MTIYGARLPKRSRRTKAALDGLRTEIHAVLCADHPMTVRQVFYRLVSRGVIAKTEAEYKNTICRLLGLMRRDGSIPFRWIADSTRWMRKPRTYSSVEAALQNTARAYRRSLWDNQSAYVEVWLEKDALAGVLYDVTEQWDVPLMVTRGYPSLSYLHGAAEAIAAVGKPIFLYYFGDHDPSGLDITRAVDDGIREFAPEAEIQFERVAVTEAQIAEFGLPTRPTKSSDSRSKGFIGGSVEVDAIAPADLRRLAARCIEQHIDPHALEVTQLSEKHERKLLLAWAGSVRGAKET